MSYRTIPLIRIAVILGCLALASGCGTGADAPVPDIAIDTLANGVIVVRNPDVGRWRAGAAWRAVERARIGELDGAEPYVFGSIRAVRLGPDGRVYVLDNQAKQVRIFSETGVHLRTVGREGGGPGEFQNPTGMVWDPDGNLWIVDPHAQRYTVLTPDGELVHTFTRAVAGFGFLWDGGFDREGRLYDPSYFRDPETRESRRLYIRHEIRGDAVVPRDTFELPRHEWEGYRVEMGGGSSLSFGIPFRPELSWVFDGQGGYWVGTGESYRIWHQTLTGDTLRVIELDRARAPVNDRDRQLAREGIVAMLEGRGLDQVDFSRIPSHKPAHGPIHIDDRGWLWVEREQPTIGDEQGPPAHASFDVFDRDGRFHGSISLEMRAYPSPVIAGNRIAAVVQDELGVERVVVYEVEGREGAR